MFLAVIREIWGHFGVLRLRVQGVIGVTKDTDLKGDNPVSSGHGVGMS